MAVRESPFDKNWAFAKSHMPAVRNILLNLPMSYFMDIRVATPKQDREQAIDLYLEIIGGCLAVRVRRHQFIESSKRYGFDWSVRWENKGHRTEIQKLRDKFGDWYFYSYSANDIDQIDLWWLLDLNKIRQSGILWDDKYWVILPNGDGTSGGYYSLDRLDDQGCIIASNQERAKQLDLFSANSPRGRTAQRRETNRAGGG